MSICDILKKQYSSNKSLILHRNFQIKFEDLFESEELDLKKINKGNVVAIIGDYDSFTIKTFLKLIDKKAIILPLTKDTKSIHRYYFEKACVDYVIKSGSVTGWEEENGKYVINKDAFYSKDNDPTEKDDSSKKDTLTLQPKMDETMKRYVNWMKR